MGSFCCVVCHCHIAESSNVFKCMTRRNYLDKVTHYENTISKRRKINYHHEAYVVCVNQSKTYLEIFRDLYAKEAPARGLSVVGGSRTFCPARGAGEGLPIKFKSDKDCTGRTS